MEEFMAKLYFIGTGIGDNDNITYKSVKKLNYVDRLYYIENQTGNSEAYDKVKEYIKKDVSLRKIRFNMQDTKKDKDIVYENIAKDMLNDVKSGLDIAYVTIGDPFIYSSAYYLINKLEGKIDIEVLPGITTFLDISSSNMFPLCIEDEILTVVPATSGLETIKRAIEFADSVVIMKAYKNFEPIIKMLIDKNLHKNCLVVSNAGKENTLVYRDIREIKDFKTSYYTTILVNKKYENE